MKSVSCIAGVTYMLLIGTAGLRAQTQTQTPLSIERDYCSQCEQWAVDLTWSGRKALDESPDLGEWGLSSLPVEVLTNGTRRARHLLPADGTVPSRRFFRLREFGQSRLVEFGSVHPEIIDEPPAFQQVPDDLPLHLERAQPVYQLRIRAVRTANNDGSQAATITPNQVQLLVQQANAVYWTAGIEFVFDPETDFETRNLTPLNHDFVVLGDLSEWTDEAVKPPMKLDAGFIDASASLATRTAVANERPDAITLFFRWGGDFKYSPEDGHWVFSRGAGWSCWACAYVAMSATMPEKNSLAHEGGHYLQNFHPFVRGIGSIADASAAILKGLRNGLPLSDGLNVLDGDRDWVLDTLPDCGGGIYQEAGIDLGDADAPMIPIPVVSPEDGIDHTYLFDPAHRHNIMSYFKGQHHLGHWLTPQMIERLRDGLENGIRQRLLGKARPQAIVDLQFQGHASGEAIAADFEIVRTRHGQLATAVRTADGRIQLTAWHVDNAGAITRKGSIQSAGTASELTAVNLGLGLVATAFRSETNTLKVITWQVDPDGDWVRLRDAETSFGTVGESISTSRLGVHFMATAVRQNTGFVYLDVWRTTADGGISRVSRRALGFYRAVNLCPTGRQNQLLSTLTDVDGNLQLIAWLLVGNQLVEDSRSSAGGVGGIEGVFIDVDLNSTVVRIPSTGDLKVINWRMSETGALTRLGEITNTLVTEREGAYSASRLGVDFLGVAQVGASNRLELNIFRTQDAGVTITHPVRLANITSISALQVQTAQVGQGKFAVAARTPSGELDLRIWRVRKLIPLPLGEEG